MKFAYYGMCSLQTHIGATDFAKGLQQFVSTLQQLKWAFGAKIDRVQYSHCTSSKSLPQRKQANKATEHPPTTYIARDHSSSLDDDDAAAHMGLSVSRYLRYRETNTLAGKWEKLARKSRQTT